MYLEEWACDPPSPCRRDKGVGSGHLPGKGGLLCVGSYKGFLPKMTCPTRNGVEVFPCWFFVWFILFFLRGVPLKIPLLLFVWFGFFLTKDPLPLSYQTTKGKVHSAYIQVI